MCTYKLALIEVILCNTDHNNGDGTFEQEESRVKAILLTWGKKRLEDEAHEALRYTKENGWR